MGAFPITCAETFSPEQHLINPMKPFPQSCALSDLRLFNRLRSLGSRYRKFVWFFLGLLGPCSSALTVETHPNFVWIIADDMSPDTGAYGTTGVQTPNLDRLAAQGRKYTRAYASAPVCSASRSAFILGTYQTTTGLHPHDVENPQPLPAPYRHLPELLREKGWYVTNAPAPNTIRSGRLITKAKTHYNFAHHPAQMFDGDDWRKRKPGQPFFAQFQISEPHRPFPIPEHYDEAKLQALQLPANYPDHPLMRRDWYAYLRSVEMVDARVGVILEQLKAEGVLENTIVMFFADHGRPMPWGKQWLSVEGLQVPLILSGPGIGPGSVEQRLTSLIDLAPTMLSRSGLEVPNWMEGAPILASTFPERPNLFAARDRCGDAQDRIRAVIGVDVLFVRNFHPNLSRLNWSSYKEDSYPGLPLLRVLSASGQLGEFQSRWMTPDRPEREFYDLKNDPAGLRNVVSESAHAFKVQAMQNTLASWIESTHDQGALPAPPGQPSLEEIQKDKRKDYQRSWSKRIQKTEPTDAERLNWWKSSYGLPTESALR